MIPKLPNKSDPPPPKPTHIAFIPTTLCDNDSSIDFDEHTPTPLIAFTAILTCPLDLNWVTKLPELSGDWQRH